MKQLLVISDSHGEKQRVKAIWDKYPDMDGYIHLGDLGFHPKELEGFHIVQGNHDPSSYGLAEKEILEIDGFKILLVHGHQYEMGAVSRIEDFMAIDNFQSFVQLLEQEIAMQAKQLGCNAVFHGHTHLPFDEIVDDVRIINPGSLFFNRKEPMISYACVTIDQNYMACDFTMLPL